MKTLLIPQGLDSHEDRGQRARSHIITGIEEARDEYDKIEIGKVLKRCRDLLTPPTQQIMRSQFL